MKPAALILVAAGLLGAGDGPKPEDVKKEAERLRGTWTFSRAEHDGADLTEQFGRIEVVFEAGKFSAPGIAADFTLDPSQNPKAMDISYTEGPPTGQTIKAIYKVEGETLTICRARGEGDDRPKQFAAPEGSGRLLLRLKKGKAGSR